MQGAAGHDAVTCNVDDHLGDALLGLLVGPSRVQVARVGREQVGASEAHSILLRVDDHVALAGTQRPFLLGVSAMQPKQCCSSSKRLVLWEGRGTNILSSNKALGNYSSCHRSVKGELRYIYSILGLRWFLMRKVSLNYKMSIFFFFYALCSFADTLSRIFVSRVYGKTETTGSSMMVIVLISCTAIVRCKVCIAVPQNVRLAYSRKSSSDGTGKRLRPFYCFDS